MASYNYGPPPPPPVVAPPANAQSGYPYAQPYPQHHQRGGHMGRGGRGGGLGAGSAAHFNGGRPDYNAGASAYGYNGQQPAPYAQPTPGPYGAPQPPQGGGYGPHQQWNPDHGQPHPPQQHSQVHHHAPTGPSAPSLPPQNYHPNYAPQHYHRPSPYSQPSAPPPPQQYAQPPQPAYGQPYPAQAAPQSLPNQSQWSTPAPLPGQGHYGGGSGGGRGRGGHHNDRGGSKAQVMGPPIRMGFDPASQQSPAPVSNGYPQPYVAPQPVPASYPSAPYPPYAQQPPPYAGAPYDGSRGPRFPQGRGPHHNSNSNFKSRAQFGGDKQRHRKHGGASQTPSVPHQKPDAPSAGKKKKRKTNTLGLTPDDAADESNEEYENEEEMLTELIGDDAPNPTDIAAWIAERRKNFPTKARAETRRAGAAKREADDIDAALARQQQKAEKLRRQLEKVESSIKRKREQQDEGDDMRAVNLSPSSSSSESKSDDEKPEAASAREPIAVPPAAKKADQSKHCKYFSTGGVCGKKGKCRFVHDPEVREAALKERERNGGRMTLQQRLILNDKEQEDLTIVKTLAYLQEKGLMTGSPKGAGGADTGSAAQSASDPDTHAAQDAPVSLPPAPVKKEQPNHGLPAIPPTPSSLSTTPSGKRYEGWNLSGFGNTGVKAGDI